MRVLYVEDAIPLADAVKHNLEKQGITTDLANDGEDGLDKYQRIVRVARYRFDAYLNQ